MTKEQKDLAWACLPKEVRKEIKMLWELDTMPVHPFLDPDSVAEGAAYVLTDIFGYHNLTSDTEPAEMLMVERSKVVRKYKFADLCEEDHSDKKYWDGAKNTLTKLFGDKCLPDKEQSEQTFEVGQKVKIILCTHPEYRNKVGIITSIDSCGNPYVKVDGLGTLFHAPYALEPYTGSSNVSANETKDDTKDETKEYRNLSQDTAICDKPEDNQLKDNMEEKELNLLELLKGCEGMKIFLPDEGYVTIRSFGNNSIIVEDKNGHMINLVGDETLCIRSTGFAYIYPTQESFVQNPLEAAKAWAEWKEARKSKRWRTQTGEIYWYIDGALDVRHDKEDYLSTDKKRYARGNYFRTEELAQRAAEAVCEALAKFHEENQEQ